MRGGLLVVSAFVLGTIGVASAQNKDFTDCYSIGSNNYEKPEFFDQGKRACSRQISKSTGINLATAHRGRALWLYKSGDYDAALADLDRSLSIDQTNVVSYDLRADVLLAKGDIDSAIANYDQSIRVDPAYSGAYYGRGRAFEKKGDITRARESYRAALVPPRTRSIKAQQRIQEWAQDSSARRLKELDAQAPNK